MNKLSSFLLCTGFTLGLTAANLTAAKPIPNPPPPAPVLGSAATFAVLAGTTVTNVGNTVINGDLGVSPGGGFTGFPPGVVNGTVHITDTIAAQAQLDLTTAFNFAAGLPGGAPITDLANSPATALHPGLYFAPGSAMAIGVGGILYLQGKGVYIFQMGKSAGGTSLTVNNTASMVLTGGADPADIYWVVGTAATFGTGTAWAGTIMAGAQITHAGGDTLNGRALSNFTEVTFDGVGSTVTVPPPSSGNTGHGHGH